MFKFVTEIFSTLDIVDFKLSIAKSVVNLKFMTGFVIEFFSIFFPCFKKLVANLKFVTNFFNHKLVKY